MKRDSMRVSFWDLENLVVPRIPCMSLSFRPTSLFLKDKMSCKISLRQGITSAHCQDDDTSYFLLFLFRNWATLTKYKPACLKFARLRILANHYKQILIRLSIVPSTSILYDQWKLLSHVRTILITIVNIHCILVVLKQREMLQWRRVWEPNSPWVTNADPNEIVNFQK